MKIMKNQIKRKRVGSVCTATGSKFIYEIFVDGKSTGFDYCEYGKALTLRKGCFETKERAASVAAACSYSACQF